MQMPLPSSLSSRFSFILLALVCLRYTAHRHKGGQSMQTIRNNLLCKGHANQLSHNKHALALTTLATGAVWEKLAVAPNPLNYPVPTLPKTFYMQIKQTLEHQLPTAVGTHFGKLTGRERTEGRQPARQEHSTSFLNKCCGSGV
jgi:hypothetical protein